MALFAEKLRKHLSPTAAEMKGFVVACLFIGFFYSFRHWGSDSPDIRFGAAMLLLTTVIAGISYGVHLLIQRVIALHLGYQPRFEYNMVNLLVALMLVILTNGLLAPVWPGWQTYSVIKRYRLGKWPPGYNTVPIGWLVASGIWINILLALIASVLHSFFPSVVWERMIALNLGIAIFTAIPLPNNDGMHILYASVLAFTFFAITVLVASFLILLGAGLIPTFVLSVLLGIGGGFWYVYKKY